MEAEAGVDYVEKPGFWPPPMYWRTGIEANVSARARWPGTAMTDWRAPRVSCLEAIARKRER